MSVPTPAKALDGHCAVVDNEQLYVLSSTAFQSIALKEGAQWNVEKSGEAVSGAACAKVVPNGDESQASVYVIGGTSSDSSYTGLQRYFFGNKTWETLTPPANVMQNRLNHSATYIPDSNKILVYAGSPANEPTWLSSQTFTILAQPPYTIDSFSTQGRTANVPIVDTWNSTHAFMTGGSIIYSDMYLFDTANGWSQYPTRLTKPIGGAKGLLIQGTDGSKVLQTYDLTSSTNEITSVLVQNADGSPALDGTTLGKRDLTVQNWPSYNATGSPAATTSDYAIAQDGKGLVALAGASASQPLYLFNQSSNGWVNTAKFFNGDNQIPLQTTTSTSATSTPTSTTATSASSSSASATGGVAQTSIDDAASRQHAMLVEEIGIIVGICGGLAVLFVLILLFLRWRKKHKSHDDPALDGEVGRMSFADRGASFMKEAGGSNKHPFFPTADRYSMSQTPAPMKSPRTTSRYLKRGHQQKGSFESTKELVEKEFEAEPVEMVAVTKKQASPIIRKPPPAYYSEKIVVEGPGLSPIEDERDRKKRSSGWSRYFATSQPTDNGLSHLPSAYRKDAVSDGLQYGKDPAYTSFYSEAPVPAIPAHIPASSLMPPLNIDFTKTLDGQRLSKVASNSPTILNTEDLAKRSNEALEGKIESTSRPESTSDISSYNNRVTMSSNAASEYFANGQTQQAWTPMTMETSFKEHVVNASNGADSRPTSSLYTASVYGDRPYSRGRGQGSSFFPGAGTGKQNGKTKSTYSTATTDVSSVKDGNRDTNFSTVSAMTTFPEPSDKSYPASRNPSQKSTKSTKSTADGSGMAGLIGSASGHKKPSNMTLFPRQVAIKQYPGVPSATEIQSKAVNTDVSWVNLDGDTR